MVVILVVVLCSMTLLYDFAIIVAPNSVVDTRVVAMLQLKPPLMFIYLLFCFVFL